MMNVETEDGLLIAVSLAEQWNSSLASAKQQLHLPRKLRHQDHLLMPMLWKPIFVS